MPDNILGDVFEELKDTASRAVSQASPLKIVETGVQQVTGQQIKQMKAIDEKNKEPELAAIRQNLAQMMQSKPKPKEELPKNITGAKGTPKSVEEFQEQQEKIKKEETKLPDISERLKLKNRGANEAFRGVSG